MEGLSKNLRDALQYLATKSEVTTLLVQLAERLELHKTDGPEEPLVLDLEPEPFMDWTEGVEGLQNLTEEDLYRMLGFDDKRIPFLVTEIERDTDIGADLDTDERKDRVTAHPSLGVDKQPFALKWHQLVGVVKMVQCAMTSRAVLLMDDVGLGKTLQVIAFFAVIAYYRQYHSDKKAYPGFWGECLMALRNRTSESR